MTVLERFLKYVEVDTRSDDNSDTYPSTEKQWDLLRLLEKEARELGLQEVSLDQYGYLMATLPASSPKPVPVIGFIAHVDTSPDMSGTDVKARLTEDYDGGDILLNQDAKLVLSPAEFPELLHYVGNTLITTDGTTLLGADDKAGIAEIMTAMEYLLQHPEIPHGKIRIGFTPDEEIGKGVDHFDVQKFGADFAYTMDGGGLGELEYENFNAAHAKVNFQGRNIHPGYAKNKMVNAMIIAMEFNELLPVNERPECTTAYEGFYHLIKMEGSVENASLQYILRDHDREKFERRKLMINEVAAFINQKYGRDIVGLELKDQYFNMKEKIEPVMHVVETARKAMEAAGIQPVVVPIRGGTDGARLSYMGLPCPNIFAGGHNFHGKFEYVPVESMEKAVQVILNVIRMNHDDFEK